mmetsp:Transcript_9723/g.13288  ORF Transcript_9723/g.13288 Transcript_9723/m.13288 type:complete len:250 (-) Transcript_9723:28-777(-)
MESLADLSVEEGANTISVLQHGDIRAEALVHATELEADNTAANDGHALRDLLQGESTSGTDDVLLVKGESSGRGKLIRLGAGGNDDILGSELIDTAVVQINGDIIVGLELAPSLDVVDGVLLHEVLDAASEAVDGGLLALHELAEVHRDLASVDTETLEVVLSLMELVCRVQEGLRGDAAHVEAGATESTSLLNDDGLETALTSLDGRNVAAWATANDSDVVLATAEGHTRETHEGHGVGPSSLEHCGS